MIQTYLKSCQIFIYRINRAKISSVSFIKIKIPVSFPINIKTWNTFQSESFFISRLAICCESSSLVLLYPFLPCAGSSPYLPLFSPDLCDDTPSVPDKRAFFYKPDAAVPDSLVQPDILSVFSPVS